MGEELEYICELLNLKIDTVRKAIQQGRIIIPDIQFEADDSPFTKSERNILDDGQQMGKACSNATERVLCAKTGTSCELKFSNQTDLQHAGVLLALPALLSQGLLKYEEDFSLEKGYYPTSSIFLSLAILALLRIKTLSGVNSLPSGELGRIIGLDRIPEVKTLRTRIAQFSEITDVSDWELNLSKDWMEDNPELSAVLYIDGHVKLYYGKDKSPPKRFVSRMRLSLSGTTDYWVNDALGQPFFVINKTISKGLIAAIKDDFTDRFIKDVPNQPSDDELSEDKYKSRFMLVFDREGYSPDFFYDLWQKRIAISTYKKNVYFKRLIF